MQMVIAWCYAVLAGGLHVPLDLLLFKPSSLLGDHLLCAVLLL